MYRHVADVLLISHTVQLGLTAYSRSRASMDLVRPSE